MQEIVQIPLVLAQTTSAVFLTLVKSLLAPLLLGLVLAGVGRVRDSDSAGRVGWRALVYFEVMTTVALLVGWAAMEWWRPGAGIGAGIGANSGGAVEVGASLTDVLVRAVPESGVAAMARNEVLPMMLFFGLLGVAARARRAQVLVDFAESLQAVMLRYAGYVMWLAPYGMVAAVLVVVLDGGWRNAVLLGRFVATALAAQLFFGVVVYGAVIALAKIPLGRFLRCSAGALGLAVTTTSSAAALPKALEGMERFGVRREILAVVMPLGLSFNLCGSNIQLMMGVLFAAQAVGVELDWRQVLAVLLTLKVAAKGVAGIPRANFVILSATLPMFELPLAALPLLLAVDGVIDMVRTPVNVMGNCLASAVIERWELSQQRG